MAVLSLSSVGPWFGIDGSRLRGALFGDGKLTRVDEQEDARTRRDFITEMLDRNPDAFASELDVQSMMRMFPGQF